MGLCLSSPEAVSSANIDRDIKKEEEKLRFQVCLLLLGKYSACLKVLLLYPNKRFPASLGAGESGKSTVLKQMKLINGHGFTTSERELFRIAIFANLLTSIQGVIRDIKSLRSFKYVNPENAKHERFLMQHTHPPRLERGVPFPPEFHRAMASIWKDRNVQKALLQVKKMILNDSTIQ
jgi:hypothetical protein